MSKFFLMALVAAMFTGSVSVVMADETKKPEEKKEEKKGEEAKKPEEKKTEEKK